MNALSCALVGGGGCPAWVVVLVGIISVLLRIYLR